ncbi:MAG TPA: MmcQ/YjbR family DNA-binding protein [Candidatus Aquilonibacter sp.]|nr:MmcQ/YjbR family DNA-binding protein [Candidatus Aquilonibacter sp.]
MHLRRVRRICMSMADATENLSHGEPTFFVKKRVFTMFANNHHDDGRIAVWIPAPPGLQLALIHSAPKVYFRPPYVGAAGWVGIELSEIADEDLAAHIQEAWNFVASKQKRKTLDKRS